MVVRSPAGALRADLVRLRSRAPEATRPPRSVGRVVDPGDEGRSARDGVRVALEAPAWLTLAESYNVGWRAECDGRDLGAPRPVDGYANGWRAPRDCREVRFAFAAQRAVDIGYAASGIACLALLALLAVGALRRRRAGRWGAGALAEGPSAAVSGVRPAPARRTTARRALAIGAAVGLVGGFVFALRAGVVIGPAVALLLWRGAGPAPLAIAAGALTAIALPAIHLLWPPDDNGGFNSSYASDVLGAHWIAVAAWVLLALALSRAIPRRRASAPPGADAT